MKTGKESSGISARTSQHDKGLYPGENHILPFHFIREILLDKIHIFLSVGFLIEAKSKRRTTRVLLLQDTPPNTIALHGVLESCLHFFQSEISAKSLP